MKMHVDIINIYQRINTTSNMMKEKEEIRNRIIAGAIRMFEKECLCSLIEVLQLGQGYDTTC